MSPSTSLPCVESLTEGPIGESDLVFNAVDQRKIACIKVQRPPGKRPYLQRGYQRSIACILSSLQQGNGDFVILRSVELKPPWTRSSSRSNFFNGARGCRRQDERDI